MNALLELDRVFLRYSGADRDAVRDVSLEVYGGDIVALVGPNGSGKSTVLAGPGGEIRPRRGAVRLGGVELASQPRRKVSQRVARLPQTPQAPEGLPVEALVRHGRTPHLRPMAPLTHRDRAAIDDALSAVELQDFRARPLESLSGGERRRAWLAMVLAQEPEILLLDEPTAALDLRHEWEVLQLLARANRERGLTLVISLHDLGQASSFAHRVAVMARGRLYTIGPPEAVLRDETLRDVFSVDARVVKDAGLTWIQVRGPADPIRRL